MNIAVLGQRLNVKFFAIENLLTVQAEIREYLADVSPDMKTLALRERSGLLDP